MTTRIAVINFGPRSIDVKQLAQGGDVISTERISPGGLDAMLHVYTGRSIRIDEVDEGKGAAAP